MKILERLLSEFDFRKDNYRNTEVISQAENRIKNGPLYAVAFMFIPQAYFFGKAGVRGGIVGAATGATIAYITGNDMASGMSSGALTGTLADVCQQTVRGLVYAIHKGRALSKLRKNETQTELRNNSLYQAYLAVNEDKRA